MKLEGSVRQHHSREGPRSRLLTEIRESIMSRENMFGGTFLYETLHHFISRALEDPRAEIEPRDVVPDVPPAVSRYICRLLIEDRIYQRLKEHLNDLYPDKERTLEERAAERHAVLSKLNTWLAYQRRNTSREKVSLSQ